MASVRIPEMKEDLYETVLIGAEEYPYDAFPEEKLLILAQIIDVLASTSIFSLLAKIPEIISLGKETNAMHPFNSFEFLLSNDKCKKNVQIIFDESRCKSSLLNPNGWIYAQIRDQFTKGFCHYLLVRHKKDDLIPHLDSFCERTHLQKERLLPLIEKENWLELTQAILL